MQRFSFTDLFIDLFNSALHVSGDKLAHLQEHFLTVYTAFGKIQCTGRQQCRCIVFYQKLYIQSKSDKVEMELSISTLSPVGSNIGALYFTKSCIYSQKVLLKMGEFVARNM